MERRQKEAVEMSPRGMQLSMSHLCISRIQAVSQSLLEEEVIPSLKWAKTGEAKYFSTKQKNAFFFFFVESV